MISLGEFTCFIIFGFLAVLSFFLSKWAYRDIFSPIGIFICINLVSLSLFHLKLIRFNNLSVQTYIVIAASLFSFIIGAIIAYPSIVLKGKPLKIRDNFQKGNSAAQSLTYFYYFTAVIATLGWIILLINFLSKNNFIQFYKLQRQFQNQQYIGYLNLLGIVVMPSFLLLSLQRRRVTLISLFFLFSTLFGLLLAGIKMYFIFSLVATFLVFSTSLPGKIRIKHLLILVIVVLAFMVIYNQYVDIYVSRKSEGSVFPKSISFLESPYIYLVGSWPAMSSVIQNPPEQPQKGFVTLHFLWKVLGAGLHIIPPIPEVEPGVDIGNIFKFNVYSLIGGIYWDFGFIGSIIGCFLLGLISTRLYVSARKSGNWKYHLVSSIFSYGLFISFFDYYYRFNIIFLLIYIFFMSLITQKILPILIRAFNQTLLPKQN